jgi:hypothetical protein
MLMRPHDGAVQQGVFVVGIIRQLLEYILPYARFSPATEPGVNGFPRTKTRRPIAPRYFRAVTVGTRQVILKLTIPSQLLE